MPKNDPITLEMQAKGRSETRANTKMLKSGSEKKITDIDVAGLEKKALEKANHAISAIENAIATWDASEEKPVELGIRIGRLKNFHKSISNWEKKMLKSRFKKESINERIQLLREFSDICYAYR